MDRAFLVESGTYFGFLLGIVQMLQWAVYPASWTLPVGGAVVGYITNWIALKYIFEPLEPTKVQIIPLLLIFILYISVGNNKRNNEYI